MPFRNRTDAGRRLAAELVARGLVHPVVVGMARGGVPVAAEIARVLGCELDVVVVRKLGHPAQPELGLGALGEGGIRIVNGPLVEKLAVPADVLDEVATREVAELDRRLRTYRQGRDAVPLEGRTVVVVDDGLATGSTALAALQTVRARGAGPVERLVLAVPVGSPGALERVAAASVADDVVCLDATKNFVGISECYGDFHQVTDDEVLHLLAATG